jgi:hypothetical protein
VGELKQQAGEEGGSEKLSRSASGKKMNRRGAELVGRWWADKKEKNK